MNPTPESPRAMKNKTTAPDRPQHSPIPWTTDGRWIVQKIEGLAWWPGQGFIADCMVSELHDSRGKSNTAANAAFIVQACNSHAQLLQALQDVMRCFVGDRNAENCAGESGQVADQARAAIAQAQGGQP